MDFDVLVTPRTLFEMKKDTVRPQDRRRGDAAPAVQIEVTVTTLPEEIMPVRKFRSFEDMNQPVWRQPGDPALYRAIAGVWELARRTNPRRFRRGVIRFRSIQAMSQARDEALSKHVEQLTARRRSR